MTKRVVTLEDGRTLTYYTFQQASPPAKEEDAK